jgi:ribonucleoside-diphosphate reductase beta chain
LSQIGYHKIFDVDNDLLSKTVWFDEQILGNNMTDFFHSRPVEYAKKALSFDAEALF